MKRSSCNNNNNNCNIFCCIFTDRKMGLLRLPGIPNGGTAVSMAMVLPLLPHYHLAAGRQIVNRIFRQNAEDAAVPTIERFGRYLEGQWDRLNISVFGESVRTNNAVESFHNSLFQMVGRHHPNMWSFITSLRKMEHSKACDILRLREGTQLPRHS